MFARMDVKRAGNGVEEAMASRRPATIEKEK